MDFPDIKKKLAKSTSDFSRGIVDFFCTALIFFKGLKKQSGTNYC